MHNVLDWVNKCYSDSYRSSCVFFSAISALSCCCCASLCFAIDFKRFLEPIAWNIWKIYQLLLFNLQDSKFDFWHKEVIFIWIWTRERISPRRQHSPCITGINKSAYFMILQCTFTFIFSFSTSLAKASTISINPPTIFWNSPISKEQYNQYELMMSSVNEVNEEQKPHRLRKVV